MQQRKEVLGDCFDIITAFSRDGPEKVYVQHKMKEHAKEINELLEQKAYFYVCGDAANMARDVNDVLSTIISEQRGVSKQKGEEIVITRHGKEVARLVPARGAFDRQAARRAAEELRDMSKGVRLEDLAMNGLINEGRK